MKKEFKKLLKEAFEAGRDYQYQSEHPTTVHQYPSFTKWYNNKTEKHPTNSEQLKALESDSELLLCGVCDKETKHDTTLRNELHCLKCGNVAK